MGVWLFLILHCLLCLAGYLLIKAGILKSSSMIVAIAFLIPVFGFCCLLILEWETRGDLQSKKEVGIEKLKINDEIHKSILMEDDTAQDLMVPLQEALLMNDAFTRRELMMNILYDDAGKYVEVLKKARMNDDTEVVHYATTAMVELQKDYEARLQEAKRAYEGEAENERRLKEYSQVLEEYINSGLPEGNRLKEMCAVYGQLLDQQIERIAGREEIPEEAIGLYRRKFENDLRLEDLSDAQLMAAHVMERWPDREEGYLLKIRYAVQKKDREEIHRMVELIRNRKVYLSPEARRTVEFWKDDNDAEE